jgi:hypothetical protein
MKVYSALFNWRRISKACSADFNAMGCVTQAGLVWPCLLNSRCHIEYNKGNPSGFDIQLWFQFLASFLPIPQRFSLVWDTVHILSIILLIVLTICYRILGKSFIRIVFNDVCFGRRLIRVDDSYFGLAPSDTNIRDEIFLIKGVYIFIIVRNDDGGYRLIGNGYLGSCMDENVDFYRELQSITLY